MHDYATSACSPSPPRPGLRVHRGDLKEANRQLTRAMRARPSCTFVLPWLAVRVRLQLAKVYWALGRPDDRSSPAAGDRRHPAPPAGARRPRRRGLGTSASCVDVESPSRSDRRVAAQPGGAAAAPVPADPPHHPRDRRAAVRVPQHRQLRGRLDLPQARASRHASDAVNRPRRSVCSAGSRRSVTGLLLQGLLDVVAERHRELRGRRDDAGQPDDGHDADQHVDDLGGRRARTHRGIGVCPVGRRRRHRPRPTRPGGRAPASSDRARRAVSGRSRRTLRRTGRR